MKGSIKEEKDEDLENNSKENIDVKLENKYIQEINILKYINTKNINNFNLSVNYNIDNKDQIKDKEDTNSNLQNKRIFEYKIQIIFYSMIGSSLLLHWFHFIFSDYVR